MKDSEDFLEGKFQYFSGLEGPISDIQDFSGPVDTPTYYSQSS